MNKMMNHVLKIVAIAAANFGATYMLILAQMGLGVLTRDSFGHLAIIFIHGSLLWALCPLYMIRDSLPDCFSDEILLPLIVNSILWGTITYAIGVCIWKTIRKVLAIY